MPLTLKVKRLTPTAKLPTKAHASDAGFDLYCSSRVVIPAGCGTLASTGIAVEIPPGWYAQIQDRSSLAKNGIISAGGVIDPGYRGEWIIALFSIDRVMPRRFEAGDKVAQFVLIECPPAEVVEVDELSDTPRGTGGFGSTGR